MDIKARFGNFRRAGIVFRVEMCNWVMTVCLSAHTELTRTKTMSAKSVTSNVMVAALMLYVIIAQFIS